MRCFFVPRDPRWPSFRATARYTCRASGSAEILATVSKYSPGSGRKTRSSSILWIRLPRARWLRSGRRRQSRRQRTNISPLAPMWQRTRKSSEACEAWRFPIAISFVLALEVACTVGPNYQRPKVGAPPAFKEAPPPGWKEAEPRDEIAKGNWWVVFGDPVLDGLEQQASTANQSL